MSFLARYEVASGQRINKEKSCVLLGKKAAPSRSRVHIVTATTGIQIGKLPIQYLGVPLFAGAPKSAYFQTLLDKIKKKI